MASNKTENEKLAPIIIKRVKKVDGAHHGGAWKVAYADFVTAMMAFFLLLWLLNVTTDEQKNAISNYFDPTFPRVSQNTSGAGGILGGVSAAIDGAMVSTVQPITQQPTEATTRGAMDSKDMPGDSEQGLDMDGGFYNTLDMSEAQLEAEFRKLEDARFEKAAEELREEIAQSEALKDLAEHVVVDVTPEGLRIQIVDDQGRSMFESGSAVMHGFMRELLLEVAEVIEPMPNQVSVRGHTDSVKYREPNRYDNWNLSADRAQSSRRVLGEGGLKPSRIENVMGRADRDPLLPDDPTNARNRRISIVLLREVRKPTTPSEQDKSRDATRQGQQRPAQQRQSDLRIVDDTAPDNQPARAQGGVWAGNQRADTENRNGPNLSTQQPAPALPVQPDTRTRPVTSQVETFSSTDRGGDMVVAPVNKPPTISTPVFNFGRKTPATAPKPDAPVAAAPARTKTPSSAATTPDGEHKTLTFP